MSNYANENVRVVTGTKSVKESRVVYTHIDDYEPAEYDAADNVHLYAFDTEDKGDEIADVVMELKKDFIFASGVVFPDWMGKYIDDCSTETLNTVEWRVAVGYELDEIDMEVIMEFHGDNYE